MVFRVVLHGLARREPRAAVDRKRNLGMIGIPQSTMVNLDVWHAPRTS